MCFKCLWSLQSTHVLQPIPAAISHSFSFFFRGNPDSPMAENGTDNESQCTVACSNASTLVLPGTGSAEPDLQLAAVHGGDGKVCCTCSVKETAANCVKVRASSKSQPEEVWRCKKCHNPKSRINRIMSNNGALAADWGEMTESERANFIKKHKDLYGAELETKISESMTIMKGKRSLTAFVGIGEFKKNIHLYEDVSYSTRQEDSEERTEAQKMRLEAGPNVLQIDGEAEAEQGGRKKRKSNNQQVVNLGGEDKPKKEPKEKVQKVSKYDISFAKKYISQLAPQKVELSGLMDKTKGQEHLLPAHVLTFATQTLGRIDHWYQTIEPVFKAEKNLEEVEKDKKKLEEDLKHAVHEGSMATERLRVQVNEMARWK